MKKMILLSGLSVVLSFSSLLHAEEQEEKKPVCQYPELALEFLETSRFPDVFQSASDKYTQASLGLQSEQEIKKQHEEMEKTMGWSALKPSFIEAVCNFYLREELQAAVDFNKTPMGAILVKKRNQIGDILGAAIAEKMMEQLSEKLSQAFPIVEDVLKQADETAPE